MQQSQGLAVGDKKFAFIEPRLLRRALVFEKKQVALDLTGDDVQESVPVDIVVSWIATDDPTVIAGTPVEPGTAITLRVSAGVNEASATSRLKA